VRRAQSTVFWNADVPEPRLYEALAGSVPGARIGSPENRRSPRRWRRRPLALLLGGCGEAGAERAAARRDPDPGLPVRTLFTPDLTPRSEGFQDEGVDLTIRAPSESTADSAKLLEAGRHFSVMPSTTSSSPVRGPHLSRSRHRARAARLGDRPRSQRDPTPADLAGRRSASPASLGRRGLNTCSGSGCVNPPHSTAGHRFNPCPGPAWGKIVRPTAFCSAWESSSPQWDPIPISVLDDSARPAIDLVVAPHPSV